jgi:hypothetical protein
VAAVAAAVGTGATKLRTFRRSTLGTASAVPFFFGPALRREKTKGQPPPRAKWGLSLARLSAVSYGQEPVWLTDTPAASAEHAFE